MTQQPGEAELRRKISRFLHQDVSQIGLDEHLDEVLGFDSLTGLELMSSIERHFDVYLSDEHLAQPRTLRNMIAALEASSWREAS